MFLVVSKKSESITPAKFQLDRVKTVRDMKALIPIWPLPQAIPKNNEIFFVQSKNFLFPVLSGGKDSTPAKFQLDRIKTVRDMLAHILIWPLPETIPQKLRKIFFRPIKKIFVSGFKWG